MTDSKRKITSWRFNVAAVAILLVAFFGYAIVARIGASSGTVIPYYPADCTITQDTQRLTSADARTFVTSYSDGERAGLNLNFTCGGTSPANGEYSLSNHLLADHHVIKDKLIYSASASPNSTVVTTCNASYSGSDDDRMGDRFLLLDCGRATFKLSYSGTLGSDN